MSIRPRWIRRWPRFGAIRDASDRKRASKMGLYSRAREPTSSSRMHARAPPVAHPPELAAPAHAPHTGHAGPKKLRKWASPRCGTAPRWKSAPPARFRNERWARARLTSASLHFRVFERAPSWCAHDRPVMGGAGSAGASGWVFGARPVWGERANAARARRGSARTHTGAHDRAALSDSA